MAADNQAGQIVTFLWRFGPVGDHAGKSRAHLLHACARWNLQNELQTAPGPQDYLYSIDAPNVDRRISFPAAVCHAFIPWNKLPEPYCSLIEKPNYGTHWRAMGRSGAGPLTWREYRVVPFDRRDGTGTLDWGNIPTLPAVSATTLVVPCLTSKGIAFVDGDATVTNRTEDTYELPRSQKPIIQDNSYGGWVGSGFYSSATFDNSSPGPCPPGVRPIITAQISDAGAYTGFTIADAGSGLLGEKAFGWIERSFYGYPVKPVRFEMTITDGSVSAVVATDLGGGARFDSPGTAWSITIPISWCDSVPSNLGGMPMVYQYSTGGLLTGRGEAVHGIPVIDLVSGVEERIAPPCDYRVDATYASGLNICAFGTTWRAIRGNQLWARAAKREMTPAGYRVKAWWRLIAGRESLLLGPDIDTGMDDPDLQQSWLPSEIQTCIGQGEALAARWTMEGDTLDTTTQARHDANLAEWGWYELTALESVAETGAWVNISSQPADGDRVIIMLAACAYTSAVDPLFPDDPSVETRVPVESSWIFCPTPAPLGYGVPSKDTIVKGLKA